MEGIVPTNKIVWLASYPKSGNTWFRAFLSALLNGGLVEINELRTDGILSSRDIFDGTADIHSRDLYDEEAKSMVADVFRHLAVSHNKLSFIKVHDAYECDMEGSPIIPADATHCALYFIRNPLDIAGSLANHMNVDIQQAVGMINSPKMAIARQERNLNRNTQFRQHLSTWSDHVISWTTKPPFPVLVLRYEDMLQRPLSTFSSALQFIGWHYTEREVQNAIDASTFNTLSRQETDKGFREKNRKSPLFFRSGRMNNWTTELSPQQIEKIKNTNIDIMNKYSYE